MSDRDKQIFDRSGLTVPRVAVFLRKSKQAVYQGIAEKRDYLNEDRLLKIYAKLMEEERGSKDSELVNRFLQSVKECVPGINLTRKLEVSYKHTIHHRYFVFSKEPYELRRTEYMDFMLKMVYPNAKVVAYFVDDEKTARKLAAKIKAKAVETGLSGGIAAKIYIVSTDCVQLMPHIAITLDEIQGWRGIVLDVGKNEQDDVELSEATVTAITDVLTLAGFSLTGDPDSFFPKKNPAKYLELVFHNYPIHM